MVSLVSISKFVFNKQIVFLAWLIGLLIIYFGVIIIDKDFRDFFFKFGPGSSPEKIVVNGKDLFIPANDTYYFIQTPIDNWTKVGLSYFLVYIIGLITAGSNIILVDFISEVQHSDTKRIRRNKLLYTTSLALYPIIFGILIGGSFVSNVFQLQYILFFVLGIFTVSIPFSWIKTEGKSFVGEPDLYKKI